jgi:O-antigen ligase
VYDRFVAESAAIHTLLSGNLDELPFSSIGVRIHSWAQSLNWIAERPVTGWGLNARSDVIQLGGRFPKHLKARFGHLHNSYLEILLGTGAVGFIFLCLLWGVQLRRIKLAANKELYAFALYGSAFFMVVNMFESFVFYWSGPFAMSLFMAGGYSQYLVRSLGGGSPDGAQDVPDKRQTQSMPDESALTEAKVSRFLPQGGA